MRKSRAETAETRRRIVEAASVEFKKHGIVSAGLNELMAAVGMTNGGFYRHFTSKDQLVAEACAGAMRQVVDKAEHAASDRKCGGLDGIVNDYLSTKHRDRLADGCPLAGLGSELVRADDETREAVTIGFRELVDVVAENARRKDPEAATEDALFIVSAMVGAITMSRAVNDPKLAADILSQARKRLLEG